MGRICSCILARPSAVNTELKQPHFSSSFVFFIFIYFFKIFCFGGAFYFCDGWMLDMKYEDRLI